MHLILCNVCKNLQSSSCCRKLLHPVWKQNNVFASCFKDNVTSGKLAENHKQGLKVKYIQKRSKWTQTHFFCLLMEPANDKRKYIKEREKRREKICTGLTVCRIFVLLRNRKYYRTPQKHSLKTLQQHFKRRGNRNGASNCCFQVLCVTVFNPLLNSQDFLLSSIGRSMLIFPIYNWNILVGNS